VYRSGHCSNGRFEPIKGINEALLPDRGRLLTVRPHSADIANRHHCRLHSARTTSCIHAALAAAAGAEVITLGDVRSSPLAVRLVPERLARRHSVVPLEVDNRLLTYATCLPFNLEGESDLTFAAGRRSTLKVATRSAVAAALDVVYPKVQPVEALADRTRTKGGVAATAMPASGAGAAPVIEMCHQIIARALDAKASVGTSNVAPTAPPSAAASAPRSSRC
jgi:hypothetical protein